MNRNHFKRKLLKLTVKYLRVNYIISFIFIISIINCQISEEEFIYRVKTDYYSLYSRGIINYSSWVTSDYFKENSKTIFHDDEIYPIEIIWVCPEKLFFIKNPLPEIKDTTDYNRVNQLIMDLSQELKGIFVDWQRFIGTNLLFNLPEDYLFITFGDTVKIEFQLLDNQAPVKNKIYFSVNGLCLKIITENLHTKEKVVTYPKFDYQDNKWLCDQWQVQIISDNQITGGFLVNIESEKIDGYYLPVNLRLLVQSQEKKDKIYIRNYSFRNLMINRDLKVIEKQ